MEFKSRFRRTERSWNKSFHKIEPRQPEGLWGGYRYSVSKLAIALSDFTVLVWVRLAVKAFPSLPAIPQYVPVSVVVAIATGIYIVAMLIWGQSSPSRNSN